MSIGNRKSIRYIPKENAFAAFGRKYERVGRIKDIGLGGLAMEHIVGEDTNYNSSLVDIFLIGNVFHLYHVPCKMIYEIEIHIPYFNNKYAKTLTTKRCGVQFGEIFEGDRIQLELFLKLHTIGFA